MGASAGIGKATAVALATMGAHVAITGRDHELTEGATDEARCSSDCSSRLCGLS
jgi:retinol dehydrogenase-14